MTNEYMDAIISTLSTIAQFKEIIQAYANSVKNK